MLEATGQDDRDSGRWSPQVAPPIVPQPDDVEEVERLVQMLQHSAEHGELKAALCRLSELFDTVPRSLEKSQVHTYVLSTMVHMETDLEIQTVGLELMSKFLEKSPLMREKLIRSDAFKHMIHLICIYREEEEIQKMAIYVFGYLVQSDSLRRKVSQQSQWHRLFSAMVSNIVTFSTKPELINNTLHILSLAVRMEKDLHDILAQKYLHNLIDLFSIHDRSGNIIRMLFHTLRVIGRTESVCMYVANAVPNVITKIFASWQSDQSVIISGFHLIETLCRHAEVGELFIRKGFVMRTFLPQVMAKIEVGDIQLYGLKTFILIANQLFEDNPPGDRASQWLKVIYLAMSRHMSSPQIQAQGCKALSKLLECKPEVYMWIGESSELKQDPVHTMCLGAILMYEKDQEVFVSACKSIYYLTADNDGLCKNLMEKNAYIAIVEGMRCHKKVARAVVASCRAIRGLGIFQNEHKEKIALYDGDLLQLMVEIVKSFQNEAKVQNEVISTIACLADIDLFRHQCYVVGMHLRILVAMETFPGDEILQEAAIEALAVLGGAVSGSDILHSHGAVSKVIHSLKRFGHNANIQKKGLMAVQILAIPVLVESQDMCNELSAIIKHTMRNYYNSLVIQKEAIVAMQILAEKGVEGDNKGQYSPMAEILVDQGCHELLFQILEKFDNDQALHDLASECLYVLGVEQDLKSRMLLTACSRGFIAGAECLIEVGADVNIGYGADTPLYRAVSNGDENMVQLLLRQEVRDAQSSLKVSLEKGCHVITGMLLHYIGQSKETGTVLWSNYNLGDLRPEWIVPTLCGVGLGRTRQAYASSDTSKRFVAKIKDSQLRRNRRMHHATSDSNLEILRHKYFRFRRSSSEVSRLTFEAIQELHAVSQVQGKPKRPSSYPKLHQIRKRIRGKVLESTTNQNQDIMEEVSASFFQGLPPALEQEEEIPVFEPSEEYWEDFKRTTLTGANIPFSPADPRRISEPARVVDNQKAAPSGKWLRKFKSVESFYGPHPHPLHPHQHQQHKGGDDKDKDKEKEKDADSQSRLSDDSSPHAASVSDFQSSDTESFASRRSSGLSILSTDGETDFDTSVEDAKSAPKQQEVFIRSLDVSSNHIASLDHLICHGSELMLSFSTLEHLDISDNDLTALPSPIIKSLSGLRTLDLHTNKVEEFPHAVKHCTRLRLLDVSFNRISNIQMEAAKVFSIEDLNLSQNRMTSFPQGIGQAMNFLTRLDISCNNIKSLPTTCSLSELRILDFSHNKVKILPDGFVRGCYKLEELMAANNGLEILPNENTAASLIRLLSIKLYNNKLTEKEPFYIPKFILELPNVRSVDLSNNDLLGFPHPQLWKTTLLKDLIMSRNLIAKLNLEGARLWSKLEKLHVSHNKIAELPREIGQLTSLQSLDLSHNKTLTTVPDELGRCSRLWEMPLEGLSLDLDDALIKGKVKDLTIYLHNRLKKAKHYFRMKMMLVGYGGRGKTSLLQALKRKIRSSVVEKPHVTVGIIVDEWKYERQRFGRTVTYTLNTWDFAGQEDFYSTHQCFLSNRTLYLVVYDISMGTDEIDKLKPWLSNIHARAPGCPVVVVGTHYDLLPVEERESIVAEFEIKLKELMQKPGFPNINCFAIVDLTRETSELEQLRKRIKDIVDQFKIKGQPVMGQKVPASYVRLGELLSEEANSVEKSFPVLRHSQLMKIVRSAGLDLDEDELKQAISFLHESGVLLHYNETALQMRDFYFINPGWLCRMMAQVVTVPQINPFIDRAGVMKRSSAVLLFTGKETSGDNNFIFPTALIPQYLHLLERFEIALPRNETELLIPSRLPYKRPPFEMPVHNREELVCREYSMPYTPIGFWSRLLTRLIVFAESKFAKTMMYLMERPFIVYWKEGIYVQWTAISFFLVDSNKSNADDLHITVPNTVPGWRLLGYLVDHVDSLVDEWYPGLTSIDPLLGRELLQKFIPCPLCSGNQPYLFTFEDLLTHSEHHTSIHCPQHGGRVDLEKLAPDVMLGDIEPNFHLDLNKFEFKESPENLCGDGGFGSVYKAKYEGKVVAVKVFSAIGDIHPHKMLRQEATILRRLKHPSVIALVAVAVRPVRMVIIEFAPSKSLGEVFRAGVHLSRTLQLKISQQIAEGVEYLHSLMIVYRDMKPDNVLIFTLAPDAPINAKITDYGISQFSSLFGLTSQEGTPAYRAPEVIRGETYSYQADIFSLGLLMYMILTGGTHPFEELEFKNEIDKAFADNLPITPITQRGCPPWPDFQDLITQCLSQVPDYRPKAQEVFERLKSAELFSFREILPVSVGTTVECMASQSFGSKNVRLWVASGDNECMQLTWLNLLDYRDEKLQTHRSRQSGGYNNGMGIMFRDGRVLCILPLNHDHILLGTQAGKIWVFSTVHNELIHSTHQLQDSVLSLFLINRRGDDPLILAGLANGMMALYPMSEILQEKESDMKPIEMKLGEEYEPVRCIVRSSVDKRLVASCGTKVVVMDTRICVAVESMFNTITDSNPGSQPIICMAFGRQLYLAHRSSEILEAYDVNTGKRKNSMHIGTAFGLPAKSGRITSLVLHDARTLWVGTHGGHLALVDINNWVPVTCTHRHTASVRCLLHVKLRGAARYGPKARTSVILSGGLGFRSWLDSDDDVDNQNGCIGVWDAEFPQVIKQFSDWSKKRQELIKKYSQKPPV